jgi:hypothetical protein
VLTAAFDKLKAALQNTVAIHYPNYEWEWRLRCDASDTGVGAVLLQVPPMVDSVQPPLQPIGIASQKLSPTASKNWNAIQKECFGMYWSTDNFLYFLRAKPFILETGHNNLLWIEKSRVPMIIRWRIALQSFNFQLRHIPGRLNTVADHFSRLWVPPDSDKPPQPETDKLDATTQALQYLLHAYSTEDTDSELLQVNLNNEVTREMGLIPTLPPVPAEQKLKTVHGGQMPHSGARRTWQDLNEFYPGHCIHHCIAWWRTSWRPVLCVRRLVWEWRILCSHCTDRYYPTTCARRWEWTR